MPNIYYIFKRVPLTLFFKLSIFRVFVFSQLLIFLIITIGENFMKNQYARPGFCRWQIFATCARLYQYLL